MSSLAQTHQPASKRLVAVIGLVLVAGTLAAFSGVARNDFINLDDGDLIFDNYRVSRGLTREGFQHALTGVHAAHWQPLTTFSHMVDCELFGVKRPGMHHLVSLALHACSVLLLFEALRRMTGELWPSALVAALFAVHPLRVESVAWASERKDVLSGLFFMLTLLTYVGYARSPGVGRYLLMMFVYCLGLLSKAMLVTLPCVLLLLDWWPLCRWRAGRFAVVGEPASHRFPGRSAGWLVCEKLPLLAAAAVLAAVTFRSQSVAISSTIALPIPWRLANAALAYVFYLWKTVWPTDLAVVYPHPGLALNPDIGPWLLPALSALLLLMAITGCAVYLARLRPYFIVGWLWYLGTLIPVIGLVQVGFAAYADRYTYLPMIGVYLAIAWGARDLARRWSAMKYPQLACMAICLLSLMVITWRQVDLWRNSRTLYEHTLQVTSGNPLIRHCLGASLLVNGEFDEARRQYEEAVHLMPDFAQAHYGLGWALQNLGRPVAAEEHLRVALRLKPDLWQAHVVMAETLASLGRTEEALEHAAEAVRLEDYSPAAHSALGHMLGSRGESGRAVEHFERAIKLNPNIAEPHHYWGLLLERLGQPEVAIVHYQDAVMIKPDFADAHINWGNALQTLGKADEALPHYEMALQLNPRLAHAHFNWGNALLRLERREEAAGRFKIALELKPNFVEAHLNLGNVHMIQGRLGEAMSCFEKVLRLNPQHAEAHYNWGLALAAKGELKTAIEHFQRALQVRPDFPAAQDKLRQAEARLKKIEHAQP